MASKKKESEGIALLSMYGDEDDEMEEEEEEEDEEKEEEADNYPQIEAAVFESESLINSNPNFDNNTPPPPPSILGNSTSSTPNTPPNYSSTSQPIRTDRRTIVDYGHDENALSPEPEEGEILGSGTGRVMFGADLNMSNGEFPEQISQGTVRLLTPNSQATPPQSSGQHSESQPEAMDCTITELVVVEETVEISVEEPKDVDPLDKFLPPPPKGKCSDELQGKIARFLNLKTSGRSFNAEVRNRKDYRNPDFLLHAVTYQDIDQIGTCFSKDVFDPHGYDKSDFFDEIEADMKREMERKEQEKKKSQKVEYISGGTQLGTIVPTPKVNIPIPGIPSVTGGPLLPNPAPIDTVGRDGRPNKKSKWDKVDGDRRNPLAIAGQDSVSAAVLSAPNAGTGYSAFAQQRRREAEEKRSSEKKFDRRS